MSSQNRHPRGLHSARLNARFVAEKSTTIGFSMQSPSFDLPTIIRTRLQYHFIDEQLLHLALRSAHREKDDNVLDDGNRGLAHYGNLAIQLAMTHEAIIDQGKTLHDIHAQDHWSKTKKARAKACRLLGIDSLVMQSVRQHQQPPSDTVLDHAFSAVIGAMWLDCERQEQKVPHIRSTILEVLRIIDAIVEQHSVTADALEGERSLDRQCDLISDPHGLHPGVTDLDQGGPDDVEIFTREWFAQELEGFPFDSVAHRNPSLDLQLFLSQGNLAEATFNNFALILHQGQGSYLESLSRFLEPSLLAFATGSFSSFPMCSRDCESDTFLLDIPKGLLRQELLQLQ